MCVCCVVLCCVANVDLWNSQRPKAKMYIFICFSPICKWYFLSFSVRQPLSFSVVCVSDCFLACAWARRRRELRHIVQQNVCHVPPLVHTNVKSVAYVECTECWATEPREYIVCTIQWWCICPCCCTLCASFHFDQMKWTLAAYPLSVASHPSYDHFSLHFWRPRSHWHHCC